MVLLTVKKPRLILSIRFWDHVSSRFPKHFLILARRLIGCSEMMP